jgi:hypothetical protein
MQDIRLVAIPDSNCGPLARQSEWRLGRRLAEGHEAEVFFLDQGTVFRTDKASQPSSVDRALLALGAAQERGAPVPAFCGPLSISGRVGIAMELLEPENLLHRLGRIPSSIVAVGRVMGSIHAAIHEVVGPTALPSARDTMVERILNSDLSGRHRRSLAGLGRLLADGDQLLHGDLNPANLLRHPQTHRWLAVDWGGASRGDPAADVAYTLDMISRGVPPTSASNLTIAFAPIGRLLLASAYLTEYLRHRQIDLQVVLRWKSIWSAVRMEDARRGSLRSQYDAPWWNG